MTNKNLCAQLPLACAVLDTAGRIEDCSPAFRQLFALSDAAPWQATDALLPLLAETGSHGWAEAELPHSAGGFLHLSCTRSHDRLLLLAETSAHRERPSGHQHEALATLRQSLLQEIAENIALSERTEHLEEIFDAAPDMIFVHDRNGQILAANAPAAQRFGKEGDWRQTLPLAAGDSRQRQAELRLAAALAGAPQDFEWTVRDADGVELPVEVRLRALKDGRVAAVAMVRELGGRLQGEAQLAVSESRFRALVEQSLVGIYILQDGLVRYANPGMARMFGFDSPSEMIDRVSARDLIDASARDGNAEHLFCPDDLPCEGRFAGLRHDGGKLMLEVHSRPLAFDGKPAVIGMLVDISDRCRAEAELERRAFYDALTGLPNRTLLFDRLDQALVRARRSDEIVAFLFLDLDGFKSINDHHGHDMGDQVLRSVAGRFSGALRASDTLARLGGDEFAVIATGLTFGDDVVPVAEKLRDALRSPVVIGGHAFTLGVSIGIALFPVAAEDVQGLYRAADAAMYAAKHDCRGGYLFFDAAGTACTPAPPLS